MRALARLVWGEGVPNCTRCVHDPGLRAALGCGAEPAPHVLYTVTCSACGGDGCGACERGERGFRRCPRRAIELAGVTVEPAFRMFLHYDEHGVLPCAGGIAEQSASLVEAFAVIRSEKITIENERAEKERAERERERMAESRGRRRRRG